MRVSLAFLLLSLAVAFGGCRSSAESRQSELETRADDNAEEIPQDSRPIAGMVRYVPLEGGFYGIVADDGRRYDPVSLPQAFRQDGLGVMCRVRGLRNRASFHMWGRLVEIVDIKPR